MVTEQAAVEEPEAKEPTLAELLEAEKEAEAVPVSVLRAANLELPMQFMVESMAEELLGFLSLYHRRRLAWKAARDSGSDRQRVDGLYHEFAYARLAAAVIQNDYPEAKAIANEIAAVRTQQAKEARKAVLAEAGDEE